MKPLQYRLEFYTCYARGLNGLEYGLIKSPTHGPILVLPRTIRKKRIKEEVNEQVPQLYLPDLTLDEERNYHWGIALNEKGSYIRVDNTKVIELKLSFSAIFEGFFTPVKKKLNGKDVYMADESNIDASIAKTTHIARKLEPKFWDIFKNLAPNPEINYVSVLGYFEELVPKFNERRLYRGFSRFNRLKTWFNVLKELYHEYKLEFSLLNEGVYSLGERKKLGKCVDFILKRTQPRKSEYFLLSCTGTLGKVLKLDDTTLNVFELERTVDEMRNVILPET
jgi:hypothetical protein